MMNDNPRIPVARRRIAKIRCLQDCLTSLKEKKPFPSCLCYVPSEVEYLTPNATTWTFLENPRRNAKVLHEFRASKESRLVASGEEFCNSDGKWLTVLKVVSCFLLVKYATFRKAM